MSSEPLASTFDALGINVSSTIGFNLRISDAGSMTVFRGNNGVSVTVASDLVASISTAIVLNTEAGVL